MPWRRGFWKKSKGRPWETKANVEFRVIWKGKRWSNWGNGEEEGGKELATSHRLRALSGAWRSWGPGTTIWHEYPLVSRVRNLLSWFSAWHSWHSSGYCYLSNEAEVGGGWGCYKVAPSVFSPSADQTAGPSEAPQDAECREGTTLKWT